MSAVERPAERMPQAARRLHRALIQAFIDHGVVPPAERLASEAGIALADLPAHVQTLAAADYLALDADGQITCFYPFSATPTPHVVIINWQPRHAMCAIDALGIPAMLGQELDVEGRCAVCDSPIEVRVRPGDVVAADPPATLVVARRDELADEPAFAACCPFTVFVCGQDHAERFMRRIAGTQAWPLSEALIHAEEIFADLLGADLPAHRPRGKRWDAPDDA